MLENIPPYKPRLLVISDTAIYTLKGKRYAFGPVVRELEHLAEQFESITWIGYFKKQLVGDPITTEIQSPKIRLIQLPGSGGDSLTQKLFVLLCLPLVSFTIFRQLFRHEVVHTRGPSVPALVAIILSFMFKHKKWWNKYAGNWNEPSPPFFYKLQQQILSKAKHTYTTINGKWPNQQPHLFSFENPCLTEQDLKAGQDHFKNFDQEKYSLCFVGALNDGKGVPHIINLLNNDTIRSKIDKFYFVGDGPKLDEYKSKLNDQNNIEFTGFKNKHGVHDILKKSHFIILPSQSEGFPKVIAEAACYGCIPIVSDVSCIGQYIRPENGYLWDIHTPIQPLVQKALFESPRNLQQKSESIKKMAPLFSFDHFKYRITQLLNLSSYSK